MLVRDLLLYLNKLYSLHKKAIIVKHKERSESIRQWTLLEEMPKSVYDYEVRDFWIYYSDVLNDMTVYITYKKGDMPNEP